MTVVNDVFKLIIGTYPFLSIKERLSFEIKAKLLFIKEKDGHKTIQGLLNLLDNPHADINEIKTKKKSVLKKTLLPSFWIKDKILYLEIPSWSKTLKGIDQKLIKICRENLDKYK